MRALVKARPEPGIDLLDMPEPLVGPHDVLLAVKAAAVCGSDIARYRWTRNYEEAGPKAMVKELPRILGHEFAGEIIRRGPNVVSLEEGQRVAVRNLLGCGRCRECLRGMPNVCSHRRTIGVDIDGGYAELCSVPAANCEPIPDTMSWSVAASMQPYAVATHAVRQADLGPGDRIAVWGLGPVGMAVILAARLRGVETVAAFDLLSGRIDQARELGVNAHDPRSVDVREELQQVGGHRSFDSFFDAAGALRDVLPHLVFLRKTRNVILIGNVEEPFTLDPMPMLMDEQRLIGSRSYTLPAWREATVTIATSGFDQVHGEAVSLEGALTRFHKAAYEGGMPFEIDPQL